MINKTRTCSITENSAILQEMLALPVRDTLADYFELSPNVSRGGMGTVYFCRDKRDKQFYALKTYQTTDPKFKDLFLKEAEFALGLEKHPNIVYTRTVAMEGHVYYMVMDLISSRQPKSLTDEVKGNTLAQELVHKIPLEQALKWAIDLCHGMEYLNSKGMVAHGDLKPSNLFITSDKVLKVGDFGTVVLKGEKQKGGTLKYSSPEFEKKQKVDVRSDIYSFGIILYEMLNRGLNLLYPTRIGDKDKKYYQRLSRKAIQKSPCAAIIAKCLEKNPKNRYADFAELCADLEKELLKTGGRLSSTKPQPIAFTVNEYVKKGDGWDNLGKFQKALSFFDKALKLDSCYIVAYNNRSLALNNLKRYEEAIEDCTKAIKLDSKYLLAYINRSLALNNLKRYEEAIVDCTKAINLDSKHASAYYNRGVAFCYLCRYKEAIADYSKVLKLDANDKEAYYNRGLALYYLRQYNESLTDFDMAIKLDSENAKYYYNRGNVFYFLEQYDKALNDYNKSIKLNPNEAIAYHNIGTVLMDFQHYIESISNYTKAIELDPKYASAYHNRGNAFYYLKKYKKALVDYTKAIELGQHEASIYYNRGNVLYNLKYYKKAISDYTISIKLDQTDPSFYNNRANAKYNLQCYEGAIADYNKAIELDPKDYLAYYNRGTVYMRLKKYVQAEEDFKQALSLNKNNKSALEQLLKLYQTQNKPCNAAQIQKRLDKLQAKENFQKSCAKRKQNSKQLDF